jgi:3D (Asp-Asp-Asp) domain-containing protein
MVALVFCFFLLLSVGVPAQTRPTQSPVPLPASQGGTPVTADNLIVNKLTSVTDSANPSRASERIEAGRAGASAMLSAGLIHPHLNLEVIPSGAKLDAVVFAEPDAESEDAPRRFQATAYCLRGRTSSGIFTKPGIIAADPRVLPIGTVVEVSAGDYSGTYTVQDTGRRVKGKIVDIWIPSYREARKFGRRSVKLRVLSYGPRR